MADFPAYNFVPMKIKVNITKEVLKKSAWCGLGKELISQSCAIAVALKPLGKVGVGPEDVAFWGPKYNCVDLPKEAMKFIHTFDHATPQQRLEMEPVSFIMDIPDRYLENVDFENCKTIEKL